MALHLGELSIGLELENDRLRAGMGEAKRELETLPPTARREMVKVSRVMDEEGRKSGGALSKGINQGLIRNSPLIVAGVGAALAAGAPLITTATGTLFAGVGAVAAAQTLEVRKAWTSLGRDVRDGAIKDASVLVPVYVEMAGRIGNAFTAMRPEIRGAFADSAPLIRTFTDGVVSLAQNAMPGLARSIASAGSVFDGLEHFLAETGTGLTEFLDALSEHSPAAGAAFASLGDIMGDLLPLIGELLGQGAELAADVLPMVSSSLGLVLRVVEGLGPALPIVAQGFLALKVARAATGWVGGLSASFDNLAAKTGTTSLASGRLGTALTNVGRAAPVIGTAVGLMGAALAKGEQEMDEWSRSAGTLFSTMQQGGKAGEEAAVRLALLRAKVDDVGDGFGTFGSELPDRLRDVQAEFEHTQASMSAMDKAQQAVTKATNDYEYAVGESGPASDEARAASDDLARAQADLAREQANLELATHGVTAAMIDQADQALALIDSGFAYRRSVDQLEDAQAALADAQEHLHDSNADTRTSTEDVQRAQLALEEQNYRTALSYGQQQADLSGLSKDSMEYKRIVQEEMLGELYRLRDAAGPEMKAALQSQIDTLQQSGVAVTATGTSIASTTEKVKDLGITVRQMPGQKYITIDAPTDDQKKRLEDLGLVVRHLPNGKIAVFASTDEADATIAAFLNRRRTLMIHVATDVGSTSLPRNAGFVPQRAAGGPVWPGQTFLVGEKGPELVQFAGSGTVLPADKTASVLAQSRAAAPSSAAAPAIAPAGGPLFHAETVNVIEGSPRDIAQELAYLARAKGWG